MSGYSLKAHGAHLAHVMRHAFLRLLFALYAFLVFLGVMPKPPPRTPFMGAFEHLLVTVANSLSGLAILAVLLGVGCVLWTAVRTVRGPLSEPAAPGVPDQARDGGPL